MPFFYIGVMLLVAVNLLVGLPHALNLAQTSLTAANLPNGSQINPIALSQIAGIQKVNITPINKGILSPDFSASSVLAQDLDTGFVFFTKDPHKRVPIASTTKIMAALVGVEYFKANDVLVAKNLPAVAGSSMNLQVGEQVSFRGLLYGMLLNSGNDAAFTIAANYPGGVSGFVAAMNKKAEEMGLKNTSFENPAGFDSPTHFSSAFDLSVIAQKAMEDYQIARVVSTKETSITSVDKVTIHHLKNLNKLLDTPGVLGIKTGFTPQAKENLIGLIEKDGRKTLTIVLGSDDRFGETKKLMDWSFVNFSWPQ